MKKMLALLAVLCSAAAAFAQNDAVVPLENHRRKHHRFQ